MAAPNEWIFELFGTSSEEIFSIAKQETKQKAKQEAREEARQEARQEAKRELEEYYLPKIDELSASNKQLSSQNDYLKNLLRQHNVSFE